MGINPMQLTEHHLDRLYKILDISKRNSIQLADFKVLFEEN